MASTKAITPTAMPAMANPPPLRFGFASISRLATMPRITAMMPRMIPAKTSPTIAQTRDAMAFPDVFCSTPAAGVA